MKTKNNGYIKTFLLLQWIVLAIPLTIQAQNELQIHQVNIGNGDCTIIAITDNAGAVVAKTIIDGGKSSATTYLIPYINQEFGGNANFDYLILSHFHNDHYNGLLALGNGTIRANYIIDGGNYTILAGAHNPALAPPNITFPPPRAAGVWETNVSAYGNNVNTAARRPAGLTNLPNQIRDTLTLGSIKGVNVYLICIAGNGSNVGTGGAVVNNIAARRNNQNNFSLGWLLVYGKFRYYTAGDIGGHNAKYTQNIPYGTGTLTVTGNCASYTDQETSIAAGLQTLLPNAQPKGGGTNVAGHICAIKISHHGSACSNNIMWLNTLRPAAIFTSAGSDNHHKLPRLNTLYNMSQVAPLSNNGNPTLGIYSQGYYFTNLYNFTGQASLTYANTLFAARANTSYDYGNNNINTNGSYLIIVPPQNIANYSDFQVWRVNCPFNYTNNISKHTFLARYECHQ
ncbi:MBL fold metallo-hydrolase [Mucilaginibacter sp.]|uniref:MBL fold metallo-hydrolase n=1 Tax=Mucilaginibacter sp. TaxID=1882438 RepID=UPI00261E4AA1|nr:MBL fold metallo-hydrolase [Mucilaginibacter sp.]MDB4921800.1 beta-lactamase domain protein [Mucilaginibacter sp.]